MVFCSLTWIIITSLINNYSSYLALFVTHSFKSIHVSRLNTLLSYSFHLFCANFITTFLLSLFLSFYLSFYQFSFILFCNVHLHSHFRTHFYSSSREIVPIWTMYSLFSLESLLFSFVAFSISPISLLFLFLSPLYVFHKAFLPGIRVFHKK